MLDQAEIHRKILSSNPLEIMRARRILKENFAKLPDKKQAWEDLILLLQDELWYERWNAAKLISSVFCDIPNKKQAWEDLIGLIKDEDNYVKWCKAESVGIVFQYMPDKSKAYEDLIRLTQDQDWNVRMSAVNALAYAFPYVPDRKKAYEDLIRLTQDEDSIVRTAAEESLGKAFPYIIDKEKAWEDLNRLTWAMNQVAISLGPAFPNMPDKKEAYDFLIRLAQNEAEAEVVRSNAIYWIGHVFPHIPDKKKAWKDLYRLTKGTLYVRVYANYSLGRASIFKATEAKSKSSCKKNLENAIEFFKNSVKEAKLTLDEPDYVDPARFCLPFYRSFYTITFKDRKGKAEVQRYIAKAKLAVGRSESREKLLEAIENLANALMKAQKARGMGYEAIQSELDACRKYCERATELLETTGEKAPMATKLIRDELLPTVKDRVAEIQEKAKILSKRTEGTPLEKLGKEVHHQSLALLQIRDPIGFKKILNKMHRKLSDICDKMPEEDRDKAYELLKMANEELYLENILDLYNDILEKVSSQKSIQDILEKIRTDIEGLKSEFKSRFDKIDKNIVDISRGNKDLKDLLRSSLNKTEEYLNDLLDESKKYDPDAQDFIEKFSGEIIKKLEEKNEKWFEKLRDELIKNESKIEKELSSASPEIKSTWRKLIGYVKDKMGIDLKEIKEIIKKLPTEAVVFISAEKILEYGVPFLSAAISSPVALPALVTILYTIRGIVPKDK